MSLAGPPFRHDASSSGAGRSLRAARRTTERDRSLTRLFVKTVLGFYRDRGGVGPRGQSGAVVAVQRTSSDLKLNPHVHAVFLDGVYRDKSEDGEEPELRALVHLSTRDVAAVRCLSRITRWCSSDRFAWLWMGSRFTRRRGREVSTSRAARLSSSTSFVQRSHRSG